MISKKTLGTRIYPANPSVPDTVLVFCLVSWQSIGNKCAHTRVVCTLRAQWLNEVPVSGLSSEMKDEIRKEKGDSIRGWEIGNKTVQVMEEKGRV